jgi:hypothetical protein
LLALGALSASLMFGAPARLSGQSDEFETVVRPVLAETCAKCHNEKSAAGGMSVADLMSADSLAQHRDEWEGILRRLRTGDMPPPGIPRPDVA